MKNLKKIIVATSFMKKTVTLLFLVILSINNIDLHDYVPLILL